jgi:hypothetical protein
MSLGHDVAAEAGCNWYLYNINKYSLSKKNQIEGHMSRSV